MNKVWQEKMKRLGEQVRKMQAKAKEFGMTLPDALLADRVRHSCYADKENEAVINYNGKVYKCNARDFKEDNCEGILDESGNIQWNDFHQLRKTQNFQIPNAFRAQYCPYVEEVAVKYPMTTRNVIIVSTQAKRQRTS